MLLKVKSQIEMC